NPHVIPMQGFIAVSKKCCWCCDFVLKSVKLFCGGSTMRMCCYTLSRFSPFSSPLLMIYASPCGPLCLPLYFDSSRVQIRPELTLNNTHNSCDDPSTLITCPRRRELPEKAIVTPHTAGDLQISHISSFRLVFTHFPSFLFIYFYFLQYVIVLFHLHSSMPSFYFIMLLFFIFFIIFV